VAINDALSLEATRPDVMPLPS